LVKVWNELLDGRQAGGWNMFTAYVCFMSIVLLAESA
jgi:hypothetical protein